MAHFFMAGTVRVRWQLNRLGPNGTGPFELVMDDPHSRIIVRFDEIADALRRQTDLKAAFIIARMKSIEPMFRTLSPSPAGE
jgi:hypothetical protein